MDYDPRQHGAQCDDCPMAGCTPVPPELHDGASMIVVGEAPGETEVQEGRPFCGPSGREAMAAFRATGIRRASADWTNAILCRPESNDMRLMLRKLRRDNQKRRERGDEPILSPVDYCRPRLKAELAAHDNVLTMGATGLSALHTDARSIMAARGNPLTFELDGKERKLFPTLHPALIMRQGRWRHVFQGDVGKAWRYFTGTMRWEEPTVVLNPSPGELRAFLAEPHAFLAYDVETDGIEALECKVRCIGIGSVDAVLVVGVLGIDGMSRPYTPGDAEEIRRILTAWFTDPARMKVAHNGGYYDRLVVETWLGITPAPLLDTILLHRLMVSELPHSLDLVGGTLTDVWGWKAGKVATSASTDEQLQRYCATDVAVTARVATPIGEAVANRHQGHLVDFDHRIQEMCVGLHRNGMRVDQATRAAFDVELEREAAETRLRCQQLVVGHWAGHNPGSNLQVARILYQDWGLSPVEYTELGDPSTKDACLRAHLVDGRLEDSQKAYLRALRSYRRATKARSTFIAPMAPEAVGGRVMRDGRLHANYNAHTPVTGRISSSRMNLQNVPKVYRECMVPQEGFIYVGADMDQLELRLASAMAGCEKYLAVFAAGGDPHAVTGEMLYGDAWKNGSTKARKRMRDFAKRFVYAVIYGATDETIHDVIVSVEDEKGELIYADLALRETSALRTRWLREAPEFERWWDRTLAKFKRDGYLTDPVVGRRRDFLDGEDFNECVNFGVQAGGAAIVHIATHRLMDTVLPFGRWGHGTGLVNQCHDALTAEVPIGEAESIKEAITEAMTIRVPGIDVDFTAEARIATTWRDSA